MILFAVKIMGSGYVKIEEPHESFFQKIQIHFAAKKIDVPSFSIRVKAKFEI